VALSRDFPPNGLWHNHPCCVLVASNGIMQNYPDTVVIVSAILIAGEDWAKENPGALAKVTAQWLMGDQNYTIGNNAISPESIFRRSLPTSVFSSQVNREWNDSEQVLIERMSESLLQAKIGRKKIPALWQR